MILYDLPAWIVLAWLFVLGSVIGSFLNVCVHRIPRHETLGAQLRGLWSPPSRCPRCFHEIKLRDNVPILGWLLLRGKCRQCRAPISIRYPTIELINGLLFVLFYWVEIPIGYGKTMFDSPLQTDFGLHTSTYWMNDAVLHWRYAFHMILVEALLVASLIDLDEMIIPDGSTVPAMIAGVVLGTAVPQVHLVPVWFYNPSQVRSYGILLPESMQRWIEPADDLQYHVGTYVPEWIRAWPHLHGLAVCVAGLVVGGGIVWVVRIIGHWVLRREAMGFGDVILMALIGTFLGWQATIAVFFLAPVFALAVVTVSFVARRTREIPYGPYLSLGAVAVLLAWPKVWPIVERICQLGPLVPVLGVVMTALLAACLFLTQGVKRLFGIPLHPPSDLAEAPWRSADTLAFLAAENADRFQGRWRQKEWDGIAAGQGNRQYNVWKHDGR